MVAAFRAALEELTRSVYRESGQNIQRNLIGAYRALNDWAKVKSHLRRIARCYQEGL